jgi:hypothetical protein
MVNLSSVITAYCIVFRDVLDCGAGQRSWYINSLRAGWSGDRNPVKASFSAFVQNDNGDQPVSYTMSTGSLSQRAKRLGRGVDHSTTL